MPVNDFSVGRDISLAVITSAGLLVINGLTDFSRDPMTSDLKSKAIDGTNRTGIIPDGWKGSFKLDRLDSTIDNFWADFEDGYFRGKNTKAGTISEVIQEADGSITEWRYDGVTLRLEKAGDWGGDKKVEQTLTFEASRRIKVS